MTLMALITWFAAVVFGLCLLAIWLIEYDKSDVDSHLPKTLVSAHALLAVGGLVVWSAYLDGGTYTLAWTAAAILAVVAALGLALAGRWITVYRMYKPLEAAAIPAGAHGAIGGNPVPPERRFPLPVVIAHGVLAGLTIVLVVLTALDAVRS
jgi:manganese efflux pump family protein